MENTQLPTLEDDVFNSRDPTNQRASSSRIHFPSNDPIFNRPRSAQMHPGLSPPVRRGSPLNPLNVVQPMDSRRRPWPADASVLDASPRHRRGHSQAVGNSLRLVDFPGDSNMLQDAELEVGVFSNEYDLAHEDPRILQDVQRALKLKARREARTKRDSFVTPEKPSSHHTSPAPQPETPPSSLFPTNFSPSPSFSVNSNRKSSNNSSDVDFSPSTGLFDFHSNSHPAPTSLDNGVTLDWTGGSLHDGERRWSKSIGKRKERDKMPPLGVMVDEQEKVHKEKLARINSFASAQTSRKAHITGDQLGRRYNLIYDSLGSKKPGFNFTKVTRWYGSQPEIIRKTLEKAEPFTWLKHLDKRAPKANRSPWNLSALIMEEYAQTHEHNEHMQTIPEDSTLPNASLPHSRKSRPPSFLSPVASDDRISFEPLGESKRNSLDITSRKSAGSAPSSIRSGSSHTPLSPTSDTAKETNLIPTLERAWSPASFASNDELPSPPKLQVATNTLTVPELAIHPPSSSSAATNVLNAGPISITTSTASSSSMQPRQLASPANQSMTSLRATFNLRKRVFLPNGEQTNRQKRKTRREREEQLRKEYEAKARVLAESTHHNNRIRQLLNRLSVAMKEYESLQSNAETLDIHLPKISKDLVESFGHDPAGVTGATRRLRSWQAVDDISHRIQRQRNTFSKFMGSYDQELPPAGCILDKYIVDLLEQLEALKHHSENIASGSDAVAILLKSVQEVEGQVKTEYNKTVAYASVVYPQLSHIVALEESYKDQYQQFWELGMDALTLLLDTVTPVWRTYGKTIGEDVRDFLIIPLYRNEFTGESKRYHIKEFPRRSLGHWFGLGLFFLASIGVCILQVRTAIYSLLNCRLLLIPYDGVRWIALPLFWFSIIIQWFAVIFEFAIVFMQFGVVAWWAGWSVKLLA